MTNFKNLEGATHYDMKSGLYYRDSKAGVYISNGDEPWVPSITSADKLSLMEKMTGTEHLDTKENYIPELGEWIEWQSSEWIKAFYIGLSQDGNHVVQSELGVIATLCADKVVFRSIDSEREEFIKSCIDISGHLDNFDSMLGELYDNGARLTK